MEEWIKECERFQNWFAALGGDISNNEQMMEAFNQIEIKKQSKVRRAKLYFLRDYNKKMKEIKVA